MRTFTDKQQAAQHPTSAKSEVPQPAHFDRGRALSSILYSQRAIGNQAAHELLRTKPKDQEAELTTPPSLRFAHDFSQVPVHLTATANDIRLIAQNGSTGPADRLPHLEQIQRSFSPQHDLSGVKAYLGAQAKTAAERMGAEAYTKGGCVVFRATPSLHTAAHEAAHVVQQRSGIQIPGDFGTAGDAHERQANAVADTVVAGRSSEPLLRAYAGAGNPPVPSLAIQRLEQSLPYVGPALSYLNPANQAARAILPGLSDPQKALLDGIFGNSLATSVIRLNPNSILASGNCYRTTGNIINMPGPTIDDSTLIHEAAHVWQSQNTWFGVGYAVSALRAQALAQILGGDWQRAYDYHTVERYRIPWRYWNAEQQAQWIQDHRRLPSGWMLDANIPVHPGSGVDLQSGSGLETIESTGLE